VCSPAQPDKECDSGSLIKMKRQQASALAIGMGVVAGLRPMTAYAVVALSLKWRWMSRRNSLLARMISAKASRRVAEIAMAELIADKLPFTPSRLRFAPLASRVASGAICGAAIQGARERTVGIGAILGGLASIGPTAAGYHTRRKLSQDLPELAVALIEDALAIGGGLGIAALASKVD